MKRISAENIYSEIMLLSDTERDKLYDRMKKEFYKSADIVAYTIDGKALTFDQYRKRVHAGVEQCMRGESVGLEDLSKDLGYNYADL